MGVHSFKSYVCYADTDAGGVVYHANYLRFMECARMDLLRKIDLLPSSLTKDNLLFVVYKCFIKFLRPLFLEDEIVIETSLLSVEVKRITLLQHIRKDGQITCTAEICLALVKDGKSIIIPEEIVKKFEIYKNARCSS